MKKGSIIVGIIFLCSGLCSALGYSQEEINTRDELFQKEPLPGLSELANSDQIIDDQKQKDERSKEIIVQNRVAPPFSSTDYVRMSWEASGKNDLEKAITLTNQCIKWYEQKAKLLHGKLNGFPATDQQKDYEVLNNVATCLFIQAEALMNNGRSEEAKVLFKKVTDEYKWAQAWDPSRGSFWSIAEKSQASIDMLRGVVKKQDTKKDVRKSIKTTPKIHLKGTAKIVDYTKYGQFLNVGTKEYRYELNDPQGLSDAVGEGIYPNTGAILRNPGYKKVREEGRLNGSHWDFVRTDDLEAAFYKWATAPEPWGVKLFYIGLIFEKAKMYCEAIKAYHSIIVHFPKSVGWTYWHTPWYPGQVAVAKIKHLVRKHPELNLKFNWARVQVINSFDHNVSNDIVITYPGVIDQKNFWDRIKEIFKIKKFYFRVNKVKRTIGQGKVRLVQYENDHWQLLINGEPYVIKGITYAPTKVGQSPDKGTVESWIVQDVNKNGRADGPYDAWVDRNRNNQQDRDEPVVGDFQLMKDMGVNTIRLYQQPFVPDKEFLRNMYEKYGFHVIMGDFLGKYTFGSGASWYKGTDYADSEHRQNMLKSVKKMVMEFKDEPYLLMWVLGNENNYGVANNADKNPEDFFKFANEVALLIKSIDKNHPVAICNGDTLFLDIFAKYAPDIDIFAANVYRGDYGFGSFWEQVYDAIDKPAFITEFGCPAYVQHLPRKEAEKAQSDYHEGNWRDIEANMVGEKEGVGNALGGIVFEWLDEWWKNYEPHYHDEVSDAIGPFPGGYYFEEWFGIIGQGDGKNSPFLRQLRESYYLYQKIWN